MKKILVLGIGNLVQSDDGFGVHVIRRLLNGNDVPRNVQFLDAGTSIIDQLSELSEADRIICVDVADGGMPPGAIYRFSPDDIVYKKSKYHHAHKVSIFEALEMVRLMKNSVPETTIIAVQPERIGWGMALSPTLENNMQEVINMIYKEISEEICVS